MASLWTMKPESTLTVAQVVGVGVPAEAVLGLEQRDVVLALQHVGGGQAGHAGPDDGDTLTQTRAAPGRGGCSAGRTVRPGRRPPWRSRRRRRTVRGPGRPRVKRATSPCQSPARRSIAWPSPWTSKRATRSLIRATRPANHSEARGSVMRSRSPWAISSVWPARCSQGSLAPEPRSERGDADDVVVAARRAARRGRPSSARPARPARRPVPAADVVEGPAGVADRVEGRGRSSRGTGSAAGRLDPAAGAGAGEACAERHHPQVGEQEPAGLLVCRRAARRAGRGRRRRCPSPCGRRVRGEAGSRRSIVRARRARRPVREPGCHAGHDRGRRVTARRCVRACARTGRRAARRPRDRSTGGTPGKGHRT